MKILINKDELIELLKISEPDVRLDIAEVIKAEVEKVKEPKPEPKTEQPKKKTKIIDHGKIVACYKGGRSPQWIADDMGISWQTVVNHLEKEGIYKKI